MTGAIANVVPIGAVFQVFATTVESANIVMTITTAAGYTHSAIVTLVVNAIDAYVNNLNVGATLSYTRLSQLAYAASTAVTNVSGVTLNGGTSDLTATNLQSIKVGTLSVT